MNDFNRSYATNTGTMDMSKDAGLRSFMLGVYNKLALGIALAGVLAYAAGSIEPLAKLLYGTPLRWVVMLAPVGFLLFANFGMRNPSPMGTAILYWGVVSTLGLSMGIYVAMAAAGIGGLSHVVIAQAFLATAITFGGLSLFGYTTKMNLGPIGSFAFMAIWGLFVVGLLALVIPMIFPSTAGMIGWGQPFSLILSGGFALLSAVIIAWQTQSLKEGYYQLGGDTRGMAVMTNWGALNFFVSFVNIFQFFLQLLSSD
ncbi:MAG: Bax inhibitor-1/YccA family protein [Pseudomonadota bacterium]